MQPSPVPKPRADVCTAPAKPARKAAPLPYPEMPPGSTKKVEFWLATWARNLAQYESMCAHEQTKRVKAWHKNNPVLFDATCAASFWLHHQLQMTLDCLKHCGGLLFAFPESTKLQEGGAAC